MSTIGRVLRIEKLSTFDGAGLRTVVFLKGCPLRCQWCSTPESHETRTDFGLNKEKCTRCFSCLEACPEKAISYDIKRERFLTDMEKCTDCRACITACPTDARIAWGYTATVDEIYNEVAKDSLFYYHSGGGVTLSGGEPLMQKQFVKELLETCVMQGIDTAVETCGHVLWENIKAILPFVDTLFFDLKQMDDAAHKAITGVGNRLILENLKKIDAEKYPKSIIIRVPVIPTLNDQDENIEAIGRFCLGLKKVKEIHLLPYHRLGMETYTRMGKPYALETMGSPTTDEMRRKANLLKLMGFTVQIGG